MGLSPTYKEGVDVMFTGRTQSHLVILRTRSQTKVNKTSGLFFGGIAIGSGHSLGDHVFHLNGASRLHDHHLLLYHCSYCRVVQELVMA